MISHLSHAHRTGWEKIERSAAGGGSGGAVGGRRGEEDGEPRKTQRSKRKRTGTPPTEDQESVPNCIYLGQWLQQNLFGFFFLHLSPPAGDLMTSPCPRCLATLEHSSCRFLSVCSIRCRWTAFRAADESQSVMSPGEGEGGVGGDQHFTALNESY